MHLNCHKCDRTNNTGLTIRLASVTFTLFCNYEITINNKKKYSNYTVSNEITLIPGAVHDRRNRLGNRETADRSAPMRIPRREMHKYVVRPSTHDLYVNSRCNL